MLDGIRRMEEQHSRSREPHYFSNLFTIFRLVAMNGTFFARRFVFSELAIFQTPMGIILQALAILTKQAALSMFEAAINMQHLGDRLFLAVIHYRL